MTNTETSAKTYRITEVPEGVTLTVAANDFARRITEDGVNFSYTTYDTTTMVGFGANEMFGGRGAPRGTASKLATLRSLGIKVEGV